MLLTHYRSEPVTSPKGSVYAYVEAIHYSDQDPKTRVILRSDQNGCRQYAVIVDTFITGIRLAWVSDRELRVLYPKGTEVQLDNFFRIPWCERSTAKIELVELD